MDLIGTDLMEEGISEYLLEVCPPESTYHKKIIK